MHCSCMDDRVHDSHVLCSAVLLLCFFATFSALFFLPCLPAPLPCVLRKGAALSSPKTPIRSVVCISLPCQKWEQELANGAVIRPALNAHESPIEQASASLTTAELHERQSARRG